MCDECKFLRSNTPTAKGVGGLRKEITPDAGQGVLMSSHTPTAEGVGGLNCGWR